MKNILSNEKLYDLLKRSYGSQIKTFIETFKPNDRHEWLYNNGILKNLDIIKNKNILDLGSHNGFWTYLRYLNGAKKIIGLEPTKKSVNAVNSFAIDNNLPIKIIQGTHKDISNYKVDTIICGSVCEFITDFIGFINSAKKVANYFILQNSIIRDEPIIVRGTYKASALRFTNEDRIMDTSGYDDEIAQEYPLENYQNKEKFLQCHYTESFFDLVFDACKIKVEHKIVTKNQEIISDSRKNQYRIIYRLKLN